MPRSGPPTYTYTLPPIYLAIPGTTITAAQHNDPLEDLAATFNSVQPVVWGGTGAANAAGARANLGVPGLTSSNTFTSNQTIQVSDDGALAAPLLTLDRVSASPAASDVLGEVVFSGRDSGAATQTYGIIGAEVVDPTAASEDGRLFLQSVIAGALATRAYVGAGLYSPSAFGGDPGAGLLNFQGYNLNGASTFSSGLIYGCTIANNTTDAVNDIDFGAGKCADSTNAAYMVAAALTKRLDANWAVGTNQGGLFSGSIANTTYHCFVIMRPDTGVVDAGFDTSPIAANRPSAYTYYRRVGSIVRTAGAILLFFQNGDQFILSVPINIFTTANPGTSAVTATAAVPTGITVNASISVAVLDVGPAVNNSILVTALQQADTPPTTTIFSIRGLADSSASNAFSGVINVQTNTSGQFRYRLLSSSSARTVVGVSLGWSDSRDRL